MKSELQMMAWWNADYKVTHEKNKYALSITWRLDLLGALRIMGDAALNCVRVYFQIAVCSFRVFFFSPQEMLNKAREKHTGVQLEVNGR